jgi:glycosyltransferase involved in cell wall biosynthesis
MTDINQSLLEVARHADVRISVSKWQRQELAERYGIETIYIPNGVDVQSCLTASGLRFRNRFQLEKFVLYVGRNDPVKNPEEFVALARQLDDVTCVMIGGDLSKSTMRELCGELPGNLHILGSQPSSVVADAIAAASVVVVTSRREGLPTLVLEAMTQNAQLVVPDEPGCLEAVRGGRFADVYSLGDVNDLTRKVGGLLQRPRQASGARDYVRQHYDWQAVAKQLDAVYTSRKTPSGIGSTP